MRASLCIEVIGDNYRAEERVVRAAVSSAVGKEGARTFLGHNPTSLWVARLDGLDPQYGFQRTFLRGRRDWSRANSVGSRGVYECFALEPGIYETQHRVSWKRTVRYIFRVTEEGSKVKMTKAEAIECLRSAT